MLVPLLSLVLKLIGKNSCLIAAAASANFGAAVKLLKSISNSCCAKAAAAAIAVKATAYFAATIKLGV